MKRTWDFVKLVFFACLLCSFSGIANAEDNSVKTGKEQDEVKVEVSKIQIMPPHQYITYIQPQEKVTEQAFLTAVVSIFEKRKITSLGITVDKGKVPDPLYAKAITYGIQIGSEKNKYDPNKLVTRSQAIKMVSSLFRFNGIIYEGSTTYKRFAKEFNANSKVLTVKEANDLLNAVDKKITEQMKINEEVFNIANSAYVDQQRIVVIVPNDIEYSAAFSSDGSQMNLQVSNGKLETSKANQLRFKHKNVFVFIQFGEEENLLQKLYNIV